MQLSATRPMLRGNDVKVIVSVYAQGVLRQGTVEGFIFYTAFMFVKSLKERAAGLADIELITTRTSKFVDEKAITATKIMGKLVAHITV